MKDDVRRHYDGLATQFSSLSNPYCNERYRRELEKWLRKEDAVLDIGCGTGALLSRLRASKRTGCDLSAGLLSQCRPPGVELVQADAEKLPFGDAAFSMVYTVNLLEHVPNPGMVIQEAARVLQPGGRFVVITPNGNIGWLLELADRLGLKAPEGPHRFLLRKELRKMCRDAGLVEDRFCNMVLFPKGPGWWLAGLEKIEGMIPSTGFFHLLVAAKPHAANPDAS